MNRWHSSESEGRRVRFMGRLIVFGAACALSLSALVFLDKARGQGLPQPIPVPEDHRLELLGGTYQRGATVTVWTQAGHEFTGRLQGVGVEDATGFVLLERSGDCLRVRQAFVYAVAGCGR